MQLKEHLADISAQKRDLEVAIDVVEGANNLKVQAANKLASREIERKKIYMKNSAAAFAQLKEKHATRVLELENKCVEANEKHAACVCRLERSHTEAMQKAAEVNNQIIAKLKKDHANAMEKTAEANDRSIAKMMLDVAIGA